MPRLWRSTDLVRDLTTFFVCAVSTVLLTRSFLAAAGYPQVGGSKFHIAHVLYGGLLLTAACVVLLASVAPTVKPVAAVLGGIGLGLFIDEVGKFVTKDVNYFYRPAIAIIYVSFVVLFGAIRWLARRRFTASEAVLNALEALERAVIGTLTAERQAHTLGLLRSTGASGRLAEGVRGLLERAPTTHDEPSVFERVADAARRTWVALTGHPRFRMLVFGLLFASALVAAAELGWLLRHGFGPLTFSEKAFAVTTIAATALLAVGAVRLRGSLLAALHWYEHGVLLEILTAQVFLYGSEQLAATLNLVVLLIFWGLIRWGIHFETTAPGGRGGAPATSEASGGVPGSA